MDISTFNRAKAAYDAKEWDTAALLFSACTGGPGAGEAAHLRGNALMRLGRVQEAIQAYQMAASDPTYQNVGAVCTNLGKAQAALGDYRGAVASLRHALDDQSYAGAYKTLLALGSAYSKLGDARNAGVAYRKAALEENNPDPAKALINLGVCFVQLRRPADAAEAYRTALDFSQDLNERNMIQSNLGQAYVASNRMAEAVQAFGAACANGYQLLPPAQADYERARAAVDHAAASGMGTTADFLAGYGVQASDPLDPLGRSGEVMPSPEQSGFFDITDEDIERASKAARKGKASKAQATQASAGPSHAGLKALVVVAMGACLVLYLCGYGVPSQQATVDGLFTALADGADTSSYWAAGISDSAREQVLADVPEAASHEISGLDVGGQESVALVTLALEQGGELNYSVSLVRQGVGWKVSDVELVHTSLDDTTFSGSDTQVASTDSAAQVDVAQADAAVEGEVVDAQAQANAAVEGEVVS